MRTHILKTGVPNIHKHVKNVIRVAQRQIKNDLHPSPSSFSWNPPKTSETDYKKPDVTDLVPPPSFA